MHATAVDKDCESQNSVLFLERHIILFLRREGSSQMSSQGYEWSLVVSDNQEITSDIHSHWFSTKEEIEL